MKDKSKFMLRAIELSIQSAKTKGGPFGCVIVKDNKIIELAAKSSKDSAAFTNPKKASIKDLEKIIKKTIKKAR